MTRALRLRRDEEGFTLVEMLVTILIMAIIGTLTMSALLSASTSSKATVSEQSLTAEARTALDRIAGDISQAVPLEVVNNSVSPPTTTEIPAITAVANPDGSSYHATSVTSVTFNLDADGDGCITGVTSNNIDPAKTASSCTGSGSTTNPDTEAVCWDPTLEQIYLIPASASGESTPITNCTSSGAQALLSGNKVTAFEIFYRSSLWQYQDATGVTHWYDLDAAGPPVGNDNGVLDTPELLNIDDVIIQLTLANQGHSQTYTTEVTLRNVHP